MILNEDNYLEHYGILRRSGRYPWGSGEDEASTRNRSFLDTVDALKKQGVPEAEIIKGFGMTSTQYRAKKTIELAARKQDRIAQAQRLRDKGWGPSAIGRRMGLPESTIRSYLAPGEKDKVNVLQNTANMLKDQVDQKGYIDFSSGTENHMGVSQTKLATAVAMLKEQGYKVYYVKQPQLGTGELTTVKVLGKPNSPYPKLEQVKSVTNFSEDGGRSFLGLHPPLSIASNRIGVNYAEDGGKDADGVIYVRPGVKDVSLGKASYAQVRIAVDGTHYLKGMAVYKSDLPPGKDLVFNTNKSNTGRMKDAFKEMKDDPDNPFGATVRQIVEKDAHGKEHVTSAMNIVNEEGNWLDWSKSLSSQVLSKQDPKLAEAQLKMTFESRVNELKSIQALTNPTIKRHLLEKFADSTDSAAVHLKAASLPRQASHVLLPVPTLKPNEIYAPNYNNGESVVLIRYPHAGTFEIPQLKVNNRHADSRKLLGTKPLDAVGIHPDVAQRLSGADFDGDSVLVIPNNRGTIKTKPALEGLKDFDPSHSFPPYDGMKTIDGGTWDAKAGKAVFPEGVKPKGSPKQQEMGKVTNLIADMTIRGANSEELARAVRHSMVVIDSEKHSLDYKRSAEVNGIRQLKARYQGIPTGSKRPSQAGASTLITRAGSEIHIPRRKARPASEGGPIDRATGKRAWKPTGETYVNSKGETVEKTQAIERLAVTDDAHTLSTGTRIESVYADHSNRLKALANQARKESLSVKSIPYSPSAKRTYSAEVKSLTAKLDLAKRKRPLERQAQRLANAQVSLRRQANPDMDPDSLKKIKFQALTEARIRTGVITPGEKSSGIKITPDEWKAIQAGAISNHMLEEILQKSDLDVVKQLATPRTQRGITSTQRARAEAMLASGFTQAEVASQLGVPRSTLQAELRKTS